VLNGARSLIELVCSTVPVAGSSPVVREGKDSDCCGGFDIHNLVRESFYRPRRTGKAGITWGTGAPA
jgi:hypothetical protein